MIKKLIMKKIIWDSHRASFAAYEWMYIVMMNKVWYLLVNNNCGGVQYMKCLILSTSNRIPTGGSSKKGSYAYFLLQVFLVILFLDMYVVLLLPSWPDVTIVQSDITIVVPWQLSTGSKHDYFFLLLPP